jgi:hypothetical protein
LKLKCMCKTFGYVPRETGGAGAGPADGGPNVMYEVTARDRQAQTRDLSPSGKSTSPRTWGGRQVSKCSPGERRQCARARAPTANPAAHRWHCVCAGTTASRGRASGFGLAARPGGLPVLPRSLGQDPTPPRTPTHTSSRCRRLRPAPTERAVPPRAPSRGRPTASCTSARRERRARGSAG